MKSSFFFIIQKLLFIIIGPKEKRFWYTCCIHILFSCILLSVISIQENLLHFYETIIEKECGHITISLSEQKNPSLKEIITFLEINNLLKKYISFKEIYTILSSENHFYPVLIKTYNNESLFNNKSIYISWSLYQRLNLKKNQKIHLMILEEINQKKNKICFDSIGFRPLYYKDFLDSSIVYMPEKIYSEMWENTGSTILQITTFFKSTDISKIKNIYLLLKNQFPNIQISPWYEEQSFLKHLIDIQYIIYYFLIIFFGILYLIILYCIFKLFLEKTQFIKFYCLKMGLKKLHFYLLSVISVIIILLIGFGIGILTTKVIFFILQFHNFFNITINENNAIIFNSIL
jgi:ABC-type lipoprotein release transport system permease subunit